LLHYERSTIVRSLRSLLLLFLLFQLLLKM
jgi:hypothetical protein